MNLINEDYITAAHYKKLYPRICIIGNQDQSKNWIPTTMQTEHSPLYFENIRLLCNSQHSLKNYILILDCTYKTPQENQILLDQFKEKNQILKPLATILAISNVSPSNWHTALQRGIKYLIQPPFEESHFERTIRRALLSSHERDHEKSASEFEKYLSDTWSIGSKETSKKDKNPLFKIRNALKGEKKLIWIFNQSQPFTPNSIKTLLRQANTDFFSFSNPAQLDRLSTNTIAYTENLVEWSIEKQVALERKLNQENHIRHVIVQSPQKPEELLKENHITEALYSFASKNTFSINNTTIAPEKLIKIAEWFLFYTSDRTHPYLKLSASAEAWILRKLPNIGWPILLNCLQNTWKIHRQKIIHAECLNQALTENILDKYEGKVPSRYSHIEESLTDFSVALKRIELAFK